MPERMIVRTHEDFLDNYTEAVLQGIDEYWAKRTIEDVEKEMPEPEYVQIDDRRVRLVEVAPSRRTDHDTSHDIALVLPYLNDYNPLQYMRARTLQLANPNYSVWLTPDNRFGSKNSIFNDEEKARVAQGDMRPLGEIQMRTFEKGEHRINNLAITGFAQGGMTALAMAAVDSKIHIDRVNADEVPSKKGRSGEQFLKDFDRSRSTVGLEAVVKEMAIPALTKIMRLRQTNTNKAEYLLKSKTPEGIMLAKAMAGSAEQLVGTALDKEIMVKLGSVANSQLFDIDSLSPQLLNSPLLTVVRYAGEQFEYMNVSGDNLKLHALMANDGLRLN
jgi:hypothetical protein